MHEQSILNSLMKKVLQVASAEGARRVREIHVRLGALSHFTEAHFREHFAIAAQGTLAEGAELDLELMTDELAPDAQGVYLVSLQCEVEAADDG